VGANKKVLHPLLLLNWRCFKISAKELQINEDIRDSEVRVIDADGSQLGVMPTKEAQRLSVEKSLDLVKIAPQAAPPVCKIMDYGKYRFEQAKREKEAKKNQKIIEMKEIRLSLNIDVGDFNTKANQAMKFLREGNKLKVSIRFRGREMTHPEIGHENMQRFAQAVSELGTVEKQSKMEGRHMLMFITPRQPAK
jgi:translation initiation factor IF-3